MTRKRLTFFAALALLAACSSAAVPKSFFAKPIEQQKQEFTQYEFDKQFNVYIYGMRHVEPPAMYLGWELAAEGLRIVPLLRTKLQETDDAGTITEIVLLFRIMNNAVKSYDVAGDSPLMGQLRGKVEAIENPTLKETATGYLTKIASRSDH